MVKIDMENWMVFDTETKELFVEWLDEPIITEPLSEAAQEWLNDWHDTLEWKR